MVARNGRASRPLSIQVPSRECSERGRGRHPPEEENIRQREPPHRDSLEGERRPQAHDRHKAEHHQQQEPGLDPRSLRDTTVGLHDQPRGAEQAVTGDQSETAQHRERRCPIEGSAGKRVVLDADALDQSAQDQALAEGGKCRSGGEGESPVRLGWSPRSIGTRMRPHEIPAPAA
jgi:hypothetical protein